MAAITVALLGGESSGKTTLGLALTHQLNALGVSATLVPEHLRAWCEQQGRAPAQGEQAAIANTPKPVHVPREPKPVVVMDNGPLVLVETRQDLRDTKLPF